MSDDPDSKVPDASGAGSRDDDDGTRDETGNGGAPRSKADADGGAGPAVDADRPTGARGAEDEGEARDLPAAAGGPKADAAATSGPGGTPGPGETADGAAPAAARETPAGPGASRGIAAFFALVLSMLAVAATGVLWWQYRAFYVALNTEDAALSRGIEDARANLRRLGDDVGSTAQDLEADRTRLAAVGAELDQLRPRLNELDQRIDAVQGGSFDSRALWLRAEAEYYLAAANTELEIGGRWANAIAALELADDLLRELANPALGPVRAAIADELAALRATRLPDVDGITYSLSSLADRVADLPMRADNPENFTPDSDDRDDVEPGFGRLWRSLKGALLGIVRVERRESPIGVVLTEAERRVARRELELELTLARVAVFRGEPATYETSLEAAETLLERDFDRGAPEVASALARLGELGRIDVAPERPDISRSLNLLRAAPRDDR